jgi:hypothetical protein
MALKPGSLNKDRSSAAITLWMEWYRNTVPSRCKRGITYLPMMVPRAEEPPHSRGERQRRTATLHADTAHYHQPQPGRRGWEPGSSPHRMTVGDIVIELLDSRRNEGGAHIPFCACSFIMRRKSVELDGSSMM